MPLDRARFALISREADRRAAPIATAAILPILKTARKEFAQRVMDGEDGRKAARAVAKIAQTPLSVTHQTHLFDFANRGFELAGLFLERKGFLNVKPRSKSIVTDMDQNPALTSKFLNIQLKDWIKATSSVETETTAAQYESLWKNLMQEGLTDARSLGKAIMEMGLTSDANRADVMARTMSIYGYNAGACDQYRDAGCYEKEWMVTEDDATCALCSPYDGRVVKIGGVFETASKDPLSLGIQNPPLHPRCLIPETPVFVPDELAAMVSTYIGPVVEITTASGRRLTVTTNHPLLGLDGFVAADQIREGDYLVNSPLFDGIIPVYPDQNNMPTTVEQEVRTFAESSGVSSCRVPVSPEDLHGDAINVKGDVNIIATNRFLRGEIKSFQPQHIGKSSLGGRNVFGTSLNGQRNFSAVLFRLGLAAHRIMGGLCAGTPEFRGEAHSTDDIGVSWPTRGDSCFEDLSAHSSPVYSEVLRESQLRFPEFISTTKVVSVNIRSYSGHVYNLQSLSGLYIANGVLSSNCRCCLLPVV